MTFRVRNMARSSKSSEIKLRLIVSDFSCEPEEITKTLGLTPDQTWKKGDPVHEKAVNQHKENGWLVVSPFGTMNQQLGDKLALMVEFLSPRLKLFTRLPPEAQIGISCVVYGYNGIPEISFSEEVVKFVGSLGAYIDVDVYDLT